LDLQVDNAVLHPGSTITANLISYGRNRIDVRFDLIQDSHIQTLGSQQVRGNEWALLDPRIRTAAPVVVLSRDVLDQFEPRALVVRITATGRPQWGRTPPPVVREMVMNVQRNWIIALDHPKFGCFFRILFAAFNLRQLIESSGISPRFPRIIGVVVTTQF
jgi:hypothetical protein